MTKPANTPCVLIIRDGWGQNPNFAHRGFNAVELAKTPVADQLMTEYPTTLVKTSGEDVGLSAGKMGNSEVGHQNIGAGRIVFQEPVRISKAIREGEFFENEALTKAVEGAKSRGKAVHLMGLASDAGVHGLLEHLYGCLELCKRLGHRKVFVHCFMDGRDTGPYTGKGYVEQVEEKLHEIGFGRIASVIGRYWAMDRDNRWERVAKAYACLTGRGAKDVIDELKIMRTAPSAVQYYYDNPTDRSREGDEFVSPMIVARDMDDAYASRIGDGDAVIFWNYRGDRPRELCRALVYPEFQGFETIDPSPGTGERGFDRGEKLDIELICMTGYASDLKPYVSIAFPKLPPMKQIAGAYFAELGMTQFRCAETEKFAHVTFFFNDYRDDPFEGEHREIIQSPDVPTYDQKPDMSAPAVGEATMRRLDADDCEDVLIINFANGDMVGHTGKLDAAIWACETVDRCVGEIVDKVLELGGCAIVTADHGNAEQMVDPITHGPHTSHTTYDVPLILVGEQFRQRTLRPDGRLADILPTMLEMMNLPQPEAMTGETLLVPAEVPADAPVEEPVTA
jgi:2,3-bisphosphoglycerate-independent phosphoglycerate mutase